MPPALNCLKPETVASFETLVTLVICILATIMHVTITTMTENEFELDTLWQTCRVTSAWQAATSGECVSRSNYYCGHERGLTVLARAVACTACSCIFLACALTITRQVVTTPPSITTATIPSSSPEESSTTTILEFLEATHFILYLLVIAFFSCIFCPAIIVPVLALPICSNQVEAVTAPDGVTYGPGPFMFLIVAIMLIVSISNEYDILKGRAEAKERIMLLLRKEKQEKEKETAGEDEIQQQEETKKTEEHEKPSSSSSSSSTSHQQHCPDDDNNDDEREARNSNTKEATTVVVIAVDGTHEPTSLPSSSCVHHEPDNDGDS